MEAAHLPSIPLYHMLDNPDGQLGFYIRKYTISSEMVVDLHKHDSIQIDYIYRGNARHMVHDNVCDVSQGDIFVIPPFVPHKLEHSLNGETAEVVEFEFLPSFIHSSFDNRTSCEEVLDFAYIAPFLVEENLVKPRLNLTGRIQVEVENLLNEGLREYEQRRLGFELLIKSLLLKLLIMVGRELTEGQPNIKNGVGFDHHRDAIQNAMNYIEENYTENITVGSVAKTVMLSPSFFGYLFKMQTSKTFTEYLRDLRLARATELLTTTDKQVIDICYECGFRNLNHFNRTFKQSFGIAPGVYRKERSSL